MRWRAAVIALALLAPAQVATAQSAAYITAYNLNYDDALRMARQDVAARPGDPEAHRTLATIVWMHILFTRGGATIDHYLGGLTSSQIKLPPPPAAADAEFRTHVGRALALAEAALTRDPRSVDARYDLGAAQGLMASYIASVEGKVRQALGSAKRAFDSHEWVLERAPTRHEAGLVVGTYRYAVAALSLPKRLLAYIAGFGGGKERGLRMIEAAATRPLTRADSRVALALMYSREGRHTDAVAVLKLLAAEFPQNRLFQLEIGAAAWRAGLAAEAETVLTAGLAWHDRDPRPKVPGERALWLYKRGMSRVSLNHLDDAVTDLRTGLTSDPLGWVRGRIHLELGKVADLRRQRSAALAEYVTAAQLCRTHQDPWCVEQAARWRKRPFTFGSIP
ncbi:MAG: tetratricopeptide repeat protein [Acidobacteria bacterium]|nr:tetratricopeptide repeat protein [Acidobacteriota bacterium]